MSDDNESSDDSLLQDIADRHVRPRTEPDMTTAPAKGASNRRSAAATSNTTQGRRQMMGFVNPAATDIRSDEHATALLGVLQLAGAHPEGIVGSLGHNNRSTWLRDNNNALFAADGPLSAYHPLTISVMQRHLRNAQQAARIVYERDHSNDQSGAAQEVVPSWARTFFTLFVAQQNVETRNAQAARARDERRTTVASITGRQAPLGHDGTGRAELRTETSPNEGIPAMRQQVVGNVNMERLNASDNNEEEVFGDKLVEGRDDDARRRSAPCRRNINGVHRRNVHLAFGAGNNDPSTRFSNISRGYESLDNLTHAIAESFAAPERRPHRDLIEVVRDYSETSWLVDNSSHEADRVFYRMVLVGLNAERAEIQQHGDGNAGSPASDENENVDSNA